MTKNIDEEIPFEIPNNWCWGRLNQIGSIVGGGTPSTSVKKYWDNGNIVWITPAYMSKNKNRYINDSDRKITQLGLDNSSTKLMPPNSIIMSSRAPIGYLAINLVPACTSQGCKSIVPFITAMSEYLYYAIKSSIVRIIGASSGTTFDEISGTDFGNILIPIPPISEQQKICELLSKVFGEVEEISQNYKSITKYIRVAKNKILENIFGENSSYKSYYSSKPIKDICSLANGIEAPKGNLPYLEAKVIRGSKKPKYLDKGVFIDKGTNVILVDGENSGEIMKTPYAGYMGSTFRILNINTSMVIEDYLYLFLLYKKQELKERKTGSAVPHLNKKLFSSYKILLPPIEKQKEIFNKINHIFIILDSII